MESFSSIEAIVVNITDQNQQLERDDALFQQELSVVTSDIGDTVHRLGLFETSVGITLRKMHISFAYDRHMHHQSGILQWIQAANKMIITATEKLPSMKVRYTLSDFPLLSSSHNPNQSHSLNERLTKVALQGRDQVEDVYPCSPTQQGILISQRKSAAHYGSSLILEVITARPADFTKLQQAWVQVVQRHAVLRTVFIDGVSSGSLFEQVVLRRVVPRLCSYHQAREKLCLH